METGKRMTQQKNQQQVEYKDECWEMDGRAKRQIHMLHTYQGKLQRTPCLCLWPTQSSKTRAAQTESAAQRLEREGGGNQSTQLSSEMLQKGATALGKMKTNDGVENNKVHLIDKLCRLHFSWASSCTSSSLIRLE